MMQSARQQLNICLCKLSNAFLPADVYLQMDTAAAIDMSGALFSSSLVNKQNATERKNH